MARDIHDGAIQRLFGVSPVLAGEGDLDAQTRARCSEELQAALQDLRDVVQRPLRRATRPTQTTFAAELERLANEHPDLGIELDSGDRAQVPAPFEALAQSMLVEAVRNARKHATPARVGVRVGREEGTWVLSIVSNDVTDRAAGSRSGMGLKLAALEALQYGGVVEFGRHGNDGWQVRLVVPDVV